MYAVIDIETTGGNFHKEAITEIAILITDGASLVDSWSTLINPGKSIPREISRITGITNEMVKDAPSFPMVARRIVEMTQDCIIVGHNVSFDYSFIRENFRRLGYHYRRDTLCTLRMGRKAFPGLPSYSLGRMCHSLGIRVNDRHRAGGDAAATLEVLLKILREKPSVLGETMPILNSRIRKEILNALPQSPGIYFFHNEEGRVIYVGKSNDIRKRVVSHFANDKTVKGTAMREAITDVSFELTGSETLALLRESAEIKRLLPVFNVQGRRNVTTYGLFAAKDDRGYINLNILALGKRKDPAYTFSSKTEARAFLQRIWEEHKLCQKLCGMYKTSASCFHYSIGQCNGACLGTEPPQRYNHRVEAALDRYRFQMNDFMLVDAGRYEDERSVMLVSGGEYRGFTFLSTDFLENHFQEIPGLITPQPHDRDARNILAQAIRNGSCLQIIPLG
jgi:DNA polymerase-3 subunit epsilon